MGSCTTCIGCEMEDHDWSKGACKCYIERETGLKPCPFCGKDVEIVEEGDYVETVCDDCGIAMNRVSYAELIEAWNKRAGG